MPEISLWSYIWILILVLISAFFNISELSIVSLNDNKIKKMAEQGDRTAKILLNILNEPSKFLSTIKFGITISLILSSAIIIPNFAEYIIFCFRNIPVSATFISIISYTIVVLIFSFFILIFGEFIPKKIVMHNYEKIAFFIAKIFFIIYTIEKPFIMLLSYITDLILKLLGIDPNYKPEEVTEEEIRMMVDVGNENGAIEQSEKEMINNIFEFDDRTATEIMTHRTEMTAIDLNTPLEEIISTIANSGYSRIPIYDGTLDNIVGILYVKDLLQLVSKNTSKNFNISDYMRVALYVPETNRCKELFQEFNEKKIQMAIVVDEYGGTSGLVTMEDLIESILGNIQDEYDNEIDEISKISDTEYIIEGTTSLNDVKKLFNIKSLDDEDYDTISGYIIDCLGYIPLENERPVVYIENIEFIIISMDERRISKLHAEIKTKI